MKCLQGWGWLDAGRLLKQGLHLCIEQQGSELIKLVVIQQGPGLEEGAPGEDKVQRRDPRVTQCNSPVRHVSLEAGLHTLKMTAVAEW